MIKKKSYFLAHGNKLLQTHWGPFMSLKTFRGPAEKIRIHTTEENSSHVIPEVWSGV